MWVSGEAQVTNPHLGKVDLFDFHAKAHVIELPGSLMGKLVFAQPERLPTTESLCRAFAALR